ncbi:MAG: transcriptional regulator NrdR [Proteobacteria bacterium]|nr:transcriptional regulator NrdR [Cystobacterineae bacterium]MCL2258301.1 transcriptional regulator NrdR [Cystobacterineae bacterium]MCL2315075.1 transcriptional regulator NrdR [Pseudomonadota bacterium]
MHCPFCGQGDTRVLDSRESSEGLSIRRRRSCEYCKRRFTTYERVEELSPTVVKKDGRRENFDRDKLLLGLRKACEKRPVSVEQLEAVAVAIERKIQEEGDKEVASSLIGQEAMAELSALDQVAYVRFASVYRSFRDISEFMAELNELAQQEPAKKAIEGKPHEPPSSAGRS